MSVTNRIRHSLLVFSIASVVCWGSQNSIANANDRDTMRLATFNVSMNRGSSGALLAELQTGESEQIKKIAAVIRVVRPDVILLNEFDYCGDQAATAIAAFQDNFLAAKELFDTQPITYKYHFVASVNTGLPSGFDLDGNGKTTDPGDAYGFGRYPGQYGMVVLSRFRISADTKTFQNFLWKDMPQAMLPQKVKSGDTLESYYSSAILDEFRLSSKSHWDLTIETPTREVHFLVSHPTPPVFDGPEDKNGTRNHDEIRFWADYISGDKSQYIYDDNGRRGGLAKSLSFVIAGDMNADPVDGDTTDEAILQLLNHRRIRDPLAASDGAVEASKLQGKINAVHQGKSKFDTSDFSDRSPGNLRIDYVLPSRDLQIVNAGVFWPRTDQPAAALLDASDHRLVWVDIKSK
jgi:endonuclease/exonuclease/phosphatase family metal-dependent hydrolase